MNTQLSELQKIQLGIFYEFTCACKTLGLRYYLVEGSMLGAVRHQGFIPWDDDIDVAMPRRDYELFQEKAGETLGNSFRLSTYEDDKHYWMTAVLFDTRYRVRLKNATREIDSYAWIDVIPLDGMPRGGLRQKLHYYHFYGYRILYQMSHFSEIVNVNRERKPLERLAIAVLRLFNVEQLLDSRRICKRLHSVLSKYDFDGSDFGMQFISDYKLRELMPRAWFGDGTEYTFENVRANGVANADGYLSQLYGDYMTMPPVEKRIGKHSVELLN